MTAALAAGALSACGDQPPPIVGPDAGKTGNAALAVNDGASLGLSFGGSATLAVTYLDASGEPIPGGRVQFRMLTSGSESTGGSTLSSNSVTTGADGVAEVELVAGAERVNFRVEASAPDAPSAIFYVAVSEEGFTDLVVKAGHSGFRSQAELVPVHIRLYRAAEHRCADIDADDIPESLFPPGQVGEFGQEAEFPNRSSGEGYTVVGFSDQASGLPPVSVGCVDLTASQVRPGNPLRLSVVLSDRPATLPGAAQLTSRFDLALLEDALDEAGASDAWDILETCPAGPGQLILDCAQAALAEEPGCRAADPLVDPLSAALEDERGEADESGCRPLEEEDELTLDGALTEAIAAGEFPAGDALVDLALARRDILSDVVVISRLELGAAGHARHQLDQLRLQAAGQVHAVDARDSARTVITADAIPFQVSSPGGGQLSLGRHGFTARLGSAAAAAFREVVLAELDLADEASGLGRALAASARDADTDTEACEAVSAIACRAVGEPDGCLEQACADGALALDFELAAWTSLADGTAIDFSISGSAPLADDDDDLVIDRFAESPTGTPAGGWAATLRLADETPVDLVGTFRGVIP